MSHNIARIAIGTVQFGMVYGIANKHGQVTEQEVTRILGFAKRNGISTLDTAMSYGESEKVIGRVANSDFSIVTKLPSFPEDGVDVEAWVNQNVERSLFRLNASSIEGILLHQPENLFSHYGKELYQALDNLRKNGLVKRIGVSIYQPDQLTMILSAFQFDLVQAPANVFDRRFEKANWHEFLHREGVGVHLRSAFLQGLLLMPVEEIPVKFRVRSAVFLRFHEWLEENNVSALEACLGYMFSIPNVERVVIGVDSLQQLQEIIDAVEVSASFPVDIWSDDVEMINPSLWSRL